MHKHTYINRQLYNKYSDTMIDAASGGEGGGNEGWNKVFSFRKYTYIVKLILGTIIAVAGKRITIWDILFN